MFSKSFIAPIFLLALTSSVNAHAGVSPALGVSGTLQRSDVQRPSTASPCGTINIAQNLDTSTSVPAGSNGSFSAAITDFNAGADGSRSIKTVQVDASGTGKNFVPAQMLVNGDANPTSVSTQQLTVQLPAGTKCTGGTSGNLCLASFATTAGFGNCLVVSQGAGAGNVTASPSATSLASSLPTGAAKGKGADRIAQNSTTDGDQKNTGKKDCKPKKDEKKMDDKKDVKGGQANKTQDNAGHSQAANGTHKRSWSSRSRRINLIE